MILQCMYLVLLVMNPSCVDFRDSKWMSSPRHLFRWHEIPKNQNIVFLTPELTGCTLQAIPSRMLMFFLNSVERLSCNHRPKSRAKFEAKYSHAANLPEKDNKPQILKKTLHMQGDVFAVTTHTWDHQRKNARNFLQITRYWIFFRVLMRQSEQE
jgi:hypothetical protein